MYSINLSSLCKKYGIEIENSIVNLEGDMIRSGWVDEKKKER